MGSYSMRFNKNGGGDLPSSMAVDFHTHILPGVDDGSRSVAESLELLRISAAQGIREVVLTPHFYPQYDTPQRFLEKRDRAMAELLSHVEPGMPGLRLGAEVYFFPNMSHSEDLRQLAIGGTDCILVEMPASPWTDRMYRELELIYDNHGLTPIIAHVDRYLGRFRDYGIPGRLAQLHVLVQANAAFFLEDSRSIKLLRAGQIQLLGSDCHNLSTRRPVLGAAREQIARKLGQNALKWIDRNSRIVLGE